MDTVSQVQGYLLAHQYEGLIRKSKLRRSPPLTAARLKLKTQVADVAHLAGGETKR